MIPNAFSSSTQPINEIINNDTLSIEFANVFVDHLKHIQSVKMMQ